MANPDYWQNVPVLIEKVDKLYAEATASGQPYTKLSVTRDKLVKMRNWSPSLPLIEKNLDRVIQELECFYIPKTFPPGPRFVFPIRDIEGIPTRAQTKPIDIDGPKYMYLGLKSADFRGPCWLGNDVGTLRRMVAQRRVVLVEGAYDIAACRLVAPDVPTLCPLTKSLGGGHQKYLRMFGVETIFLMFDNEKPKENYDIGGGELSMRALQRDIQEMKVEILYCPSSDPSKCLESYPKALQLKSLLLNL
jgi:hypothetical protein